ncbi:MAG TPA: hypothetical protein V6D19_08210 [Stenomitos sp.]
MGLEKFPLTWRWTDERYAVLSNDVLARIVPQDSRQSNQLFSASLEFTGPNGLDENQFLIDQFGSKAIEPSAVADWLRTHHQALNSSVYLSWDRDTAVVTTWGIFTEYWPEFCYPASDDLLVWSGEHDWVLLYRHDELFQYGKRC